MKTKHLALIAALLCIVGCNLATHQTTTFQTLGSLESAVTGANNGYYDSVVAAYQAGNFAATNSVPVVSAAYNDTQLAIHTAVVIASAGSNAPAPAVIQTKAQNFINLANNSKPH